MSHKIIRILNGTVSIASSDGTFFNIPVSELNFEPKVGDEVQCFRNDEKVIVFKKGTSVSTQSPKVEIQPTQPTETSAPIVSKVEQKPIRNVPVENPFAEDEKEEHSTALRVIGVIILLLLVIFLVYNSTGSGKSATLSRYAVENNSGVENGNGAGENGNGVVKGMVKDSRDGRNLQDGPDRLADLDGGEFELQLQPGDCQELLL